MPRSVLLAAAGAVLVAGCSSAATSAPAPASPTLPAGCAQALALLPAQTPDTAKAAGAAAARLAGASGTTAAAMQDAVGADLLTLSFDLTMGGNVTADVSKYNADAQALRSYCAG